MRRRVSRAREAVPLHLRKQGAPNPQPLRIDELPEGKPGLEGLDRIKVDKANEIYRRVAAFFVA